MMKPVVKVEGQVGTLVLVGQFDFNLHKDFRLSSQELLENPAVQEIQVDFDQVPFLDSSALGMLLMLHERAQAEGKEIVLCRANSTRYF